TAAAYAGSPYYTARFQLLFLIINLDDEAVFVRGHNRCADHEFGAAVLKILDRIIRQLFRDHPEHGRSWFHACDLRFAVIDAVFFTQDRDAVHSLPEEFDTGESGTAHKDGNIFVCS